MCYIVIHKEKIMEATISTRIDQSLKSEFQDFCDAIGLNISSTINIFIKKCIAEQKIPFEVSPVNEATLRFRKNADLINKIVSKSDPNLTEDTLLNEMKEFRKVHNAKIYNA